MQKKQQLKQPKQPKQPKKNPCLKSKWKERTHNSHQKHVELYVHGGEKKEYDRVFLGDSMMERWMTTGSKIWNTHFTNSANLGVGGDKIENLLYRLSGGDEKNCIETVLDKIDTSTIYFMIGTNNLGRFFLFC